MKKAVRLSLRILKITGITLASVLILLFLAPYLFPDMVGKEIKHWTNQSIRGELNFSRARLSFFTHFPSLTLTLYDVDLKGSAPFQTDTLLSAGKLGFGVNIQKLIFNHQVSINKIFLNDAYMHVLVNEKGEANYNIYVSDSTAKTNNQDTAAASLQLEKIIIKDSRLEYNDRSVPLLIQAEHFYYEGSGDLSKSVFDLTSHIQTDSLNFILENESYVRRKAIDAVLTTHINTKTLALIFEKNNIRINKLNFGFEGRLDFLKNGYDMDAAISTQNADLYQLITILPPEYLDWLNKTKVKGIVSLSAKLKGKYIASAGQKPDLETKLSMQDGYIAYEDAKLPVSQLNGQTEIELPSLNPDKLHIKIDSLNFHIDRDFFRMQMESFGLDEPQISASADAEMDLENLKKALGISSFDVRGQIRMHLSAKGKYAKKIIATSLRTKDTVIASIPAFDLKFDLKNGYVKYYKVSEPVQNIAVSMEAACVDADYRHAFFKIDTLHASALNNYIDGKSVIHASINFPMDVRLKGSINLGDLQKVYPMDSLSLSGIMLFDINSSGKYAPDHQIFPKSNAQFSLRNGFIQTKYYPHPVEKINIEARAEDDQGDLKSLHCSITPASFSFEGKPFYFSGDFKNFDDLVYDIKANGELDLGRIYQVFVRKGLGITGFIQAHAEFKGKQSDAKNEQYDLLKNSGTLDVKELSITNELFPKPFLIHRGHFRFDQDKMWFETFQASYGKSDMQLDGFIKNAINYVLEKNETLKANFNLKSKNIDLNEFAVYAGSSTVDGKNQTPAGVILIPTNLDLTIKADADRVTFNDISLNHFQGGLNIRNGEIELDETGFELIGCQVSMKGKYSSTSPLRAQFEYKLQAKDFDVHRAYQEIKLFRDLASSAQHASGIISIDYTLNGKLNEQMAPIYPSLTGNGILSVKSVKFNGWKLFNTVSSESGKSELKDPDLSKIDIKSSIKNNLITIERLKFKTGGMRIRFEGQTSFDNKVNFKMRIGLPPLGIIGIPIRITGSSDNPKIKIGNTDTDPLVEKEEP
ncbi:MAG TPA: AsmA-like C-terminal region-containing protein [Puia sp.]|nr:AsmA-like C-terminal region-containing protein [Puia sp.]